MVRAFGVMILAGGVLLVASSANAQSLGEAAAATGIHQTLAGTGMGNPAGTIGTVKNALGAAAAKKQGQLNGAAGAPVMGAVGWGGKGGRSGWATAAGGWKGGAGPGKGWASASAGWAVGGKGAGGAWAPGGGWATGARAVN